MVNDELKQVLDELSEVKSTQHQLMIIIEQYFDAQLGITHKMVKSQQIILDQMNQRKEERDI